ncbi:MAG: TolC family protein [Chlamydiales bacterium]|nr:TolC family protein [Chlamydiales bacterium]
MKKSVTICLTSLMVTLASQGVSAAEDEQREIGRHLGFSPNNEPLANITSEYTADSDESLDWRHFDYANEAASEELALNLPELAFEKRKQDAAAEAVNVTSSTEQNLYLTQEELDNEVESDLLTYSEDESFELEQNFLAEQKQVKDLTQTKTRYLKTPFPNHRERRSHYNAELDQEPEVSLPLPFPNHDERRSQQIAKKIEQKTQVSKKQKLSLDEYLDSIAAEEDSLPSLELSNTSEVKSTKEGSAKKILFAQDDDLIDELVDLEQFGEDGEASRLSLKSSSEFYQSADEALFHLREKDRKRVIANQEATFKEQRELQKQVAEDLSENWEKQLQMNLVHFKTDENSQPFESNLDDAVELAEGKHWQVVWEDLQEEISQQEALIADNESIKQLDLELDPFQLGDKRALDFALDLIESAPTSNSEILPKKKVSKKETTKPSSLSATQEQEETPSQIASSEWREPFLEEENFRALDFPLDLMENPVSTKLSPSSDQQLVSNAEAESLSLSANRATSMSSQERMLDFPLDLVEKNVIPSMLEEMNEEQARHYNQQDPVTISLTAPSDSKLIAEANDKAAEKEEKLLQAEEKIGTLDLSQTPKEAQATVPKIKMEPKSDKLSLEPKEELDFALKHLSPYSAINMVNNELAFLNLGKLFTPDKENFLPKEYEDEDYLQKPLIKFKESMGPSDFLAEKDQEEIDETNEIEKEELDSSEGKIQLTARFAEQMALEKNRDIQVLRKELESEEYAYLQIVSHFYPKVTLRSEYRKKKSDEGSDSKELSGRVSLEQKLVSSDNYYDIKRGSLVLERKKLDLANLENQVLFEVRKAYYNTVLSSEQILVNQDNIARLSGAVAKEKQRVDLGEAIEFDLEQSKVALANAFIDYYKAIRDFKSNLNTLANLIGLEGREHRNIEITESLIPIMDVKDLKEKIDFLDKQKKAKNRSKTQLLKQAIFSEQEVQVWEKVALKLRPDMVQLSIQQREAQLNTSQKIGDYYPELKAFANYSRGQSSSDWNAGVALDWDLFDGLGREYRIKQAGRSGLAKQLELSRLEEVIRTDVRDRIYDLEASLLSYLSSKKSVALAEHAHELAKNRRQIGEITNLEYRDASDALKSSKHDYNVQGFNLLVAYFNLRKEAALDVGALNVDGVEPSVFQEVFTSFKEKIQSLTD